MVARSRDAGLAPPVIAMNPTIAGIPHLDLFLAGHPRAVLGWGRKPSGRLAGAVARVLSRPCIRLEDGFLRGVDRRGPPVSLLLDDVGVYYDATAPSRMELAIAGDVSASDRARADRLVGLWRELGLSKYNHAADFAGELPARFVLVVDQVAGDLSLARGLAAADSFRAMLAAALAENPGMPVVVKVHPDRFTHGREGSFADGDLAHPRIEVLAVDCHAARLLAAAERVYTVTSLMGFEALLWGKPVRCFGMPFYAGWGLTQDRLAPPRRRGAAALHTLVHAALVRCARYVDGGAPCGAEHAMHAVAAQRRALPAVAP